MKSYQKIILIKILVILTAALVVLNISQLHLNNNNNKINLKRRDTKFYVDNNQQENHISYNNDQSQEVSSEQKNIIIDINNNNKNTIIDYFSSEEVSESESLPVEQSESSPPSIETESEENIIVPSFDDSTMIIDIDNNVKFVPGEAPKYRYRFCTGCDKCLNSEKQHLIIYEDSEDSEDF